MIARAPQVMKHDQQSNESTKPYTHSGYMQYIDKDRKYRFWQGGSMAIEADD
jgi:hypothetical protein